MIMAVILFFAGSGLSGFDSKLPDACPNSTVGTGLAVHGADAARSESTIAAWAKKELG